MAEDVDPGLIRQTQGALSKHIKKPPLHEKFLKKPPFKFLQDIVKSVIKETKFLDGKFSEADFENAKDRDTKVKFLESVIAEIEAATGEKIKARPAKIVAGLDVNKTLELLIQLGRAIDKTGDSKSKKPDVKQNEKVSVKAKEVKKEPQKSEEKRPAKKTTSEAESKDSRKTADKTQVSKDRRSEPKSSQRVENKDTKHSAVSKKAPSKPKEEERKPSPTKKKPTEKQSSRVKEESLQVEQRKTENGQSTSQVDETKVEKESGQVAELQSQGSQEKEKETVKNKAVDEKNSGESLSKPHSTVEQTKKPESDTKKAPNIKEPKKSVESVKETKKTSDTLRTVNPPHKSVEPAGKETSSKGLEKKIPTLERTDSGRVLSAIGQRQEMNQRRESLIKEATRPMKMDMSNRVFTPERSAKQREEIDRPNNIFTESQDDKDDADDMYILETQYVTPTTTRTTENKGEFSEQGQLVSQIIDTKNQLESKEAESKTKIQWEESANWRRNTGEKEVGGVKTLIQQLTRNAGPLGQLLAGLQEDVDEMMQELAHWRRINAQLAIDMKKEKEQTNELIKPLVKQLEDLEQVALQQEETKVKAAKMTVYANDKKIEELLRSRTR